MFAKLAVLYFVFITAVSGSALPVRRASTLEPIEVRPFNPIIGTIVNKRDETVDDVVNQLENLEHQFNANVPILRQLEIFVDAAQQPGANLTAILDAANSLTQGAPLTSTNNSAFRNAVLSLQYYAANPIKELQDQGRYLAVDIVLSDINTLAAQVAYGTITIDQARNQTATDINNIVNSSQNKKRDTGDVSDVDGALFQISLIASNSVSLLQVTGRSTLINPFLNNIDQIMDATKNGTMNTTVAVETATLNIAAALSALPNNTNTNSTNTNTTQQNPPASNSKRDVNLNYIFNRFEFLVGNAVQILRAAGNQDGANKLINDVTALYNQAVNGTMSAQDAFNAAVQDVANALTTTTVSKRSVTVAKRDNTLVGNTINAVQVLVNNAIILLNNAGRTDVATALQNQVNQLYNDAKNGTLTLLSLVNAINNVINTALYSKRNVVTNAYDAINILVGNAVTLLNNAGRSDLAQSLANQVNQLYTEAQNGQIDLVQLVNLANQAVAAALN